MDTTEWFGINGSFFSNQGIDFYELIGLQSFGLGIFVSYALIVLAYKWSIKKAQ